jgi:hypothetical protein
VGGTPGARPARRVDLVNPGPAHERRDELLAPLLSLVDDIVGGADTEREAIRQFNRLMPAAIADVRRRHFKEMGLLPVPMDGDPQRGLTLGYFAMRLRDGSLGFVQRRADDCLQAAIASLLQIPMHKVPDLEIGKQLERGVEPEAINRGIAEEMGRWADGLGLTVTVHSATLPRSGRWIGIVPGPGVGEMSTDHCLVLDGRDCLMDTGSPLGLITAEDPVRSYGFDDVYYGITLE